MFACGKEKMPETVSFSGCDYRLVSVLKHDFFAATALYEFGTEAEFAECTTTDAPKRIILKVGCHQWFLIFPMSPIGLFLSGREKRNLKRLHDFENTPNILAEYGKYGFIYEYIEGKTLAEADSIPDDFFDRLSEVIRGLHERDFVYFDMNKRSNILVGADGQAYIIDFQISYYIEGSGFLLGGLFSKLRSSFQREDWYHFYKHKRKLCGKPLTEEEKKAATRPSLLIRVHRCFANPYRVVRRAIMRRIAN
jgi:hypothetical protein